MLLELQDFDSLCLLVNDPHFADARLGIEWQFGGAVVGRSGGRKDFNYQVRSSPNVIFLDNRCMGIGHKNQVGL
jgi:hypothetical protein